MRLISQPWDDSDRTQLESKWWWATDAITDSFADSGPDAIGTWTSDGTLANQHTTVASWTNNRSRAKT